MPQNLTMRRSRTAEPTWALARIVTASLLSFSCLLGCQSKETNKTVIANTSRPEASLTSATTVQPIAPAPQLVSLNKPWSFHDISLGQPRTAVIAELNALGYSGLDCKVMENPTIQRCDVSGGNEPLSGLEVSFQKGKLIMVTFDFDYTLLGAYGRELTVVNGQPRVALHSTTFGGTAIDWSDRDQEPCHHIRVIDEGPPKYKDENRSGNYQLDIMSPATHDGLDMNMCSTSALGH